MYNRRVAVADVTQWQSVRFPSRIRGFDSRHLLQRSRASPKGMRGFFCNRYGIRTLSAARRKRMCLCVCRFADSSPCEFFRKSLDKIKKSAIIKVRGNTGDGYSLKLAEITANSWKVWAVISFCFAYRLPTLQLQVQRYPVEEVLPKLCTSGITSLRRIRRKERNFRILRSGRKQPPPAGSACTRQNLPYAGAFLPCVCRNKAIHAPLLGVSKVTRNRDSSIIQGKPTVVKPLLSKRP